ncbi:C40 family peptidase [Jatrophihabitans telluris]|uniref:C40 family peptidase n=1 Tax=Jatrophihabitans telluris TaxID=2038343 RepID=UPI0024C0B3DD|nr:C40 family peptidase [Jatrophihabitans telluris]
MNRTRISALIAGAALGGAGLLAVPAGMAPAEASGHNPFGVVDAFSIKDAVVSFRGWTGDPDVSGTVRVVVKIDNTVVSSVLANGLRKDVGRAYPNLGNNRGFSGTTVLPTGKHKVCLIAGDLAQGDDTSLSCKSFTVAKAAGGQSVTASRTPIGVLDSGSFSNGTLTVKGWTIDPDTTAPTYVDIMVNGDSYGSAAASVARADVAKAHSGYGTAHGFSLTLAAPVPAGNYEVCAVAINNGAGGNTVLDCRVATVVPTTVPDSLGVATAAQAADAIVAEAVKSRAAQTSDFSKTWSSAARIAFATRALLQQATGRSTKPPAVKGLPAFVAATPKKVVDTQQVMGAKPDMGSYAAAKKGGRSGIAHSLEPFAADSLTAPNGPGVGVVGAAAILPGNGTSVHPRLPAFKTGTYTRLRAEVAINAALGRMGDPYVWAASGPSTFDCSGLTAWAYAKAGIDLTHYTGSQSTQGVRVKTSQLLPGDLVLFGADLHHVGMYLGVGYMLDAPDTGAYVRVDKISWFGDFTLAVRP